APRHPGPEVHDLRAHLLRLRHPGEPRLEEDAGRVLAPVRGDLPGAREEQGRPGLARVHPLQGAGRAPQAPQGQGRADRRDRRGFRQGRDAAGGLPGHPERPEIRAGEAPLPVHELRHGADGPRGRGRQAARPRRRRGAGAEKGAALIERGPALARRGMVASPHALASAAGADALRAGGSAIDAAIACASTLGVIYPHMCGIGGDAFWLIYDAAARKVSYLDGGGRAARAATLERFSGQSEIAFRGIAPATLTTPGAVASFCAAHERYGKLPLARCLQDAIHYARDGYAVSARLARWISETRSDLARDPASAALFLPEGKSI